jgi:hypothetical protein
MHRPTNQISFTPSRDFLPTTEITQRRPRVSSPAFVGSVVHIRVNNGSARSSRVLIRVVTKVTHATRDTRHATRRPIPRGHTEPHSRTPNFENIPRELAPFPSSELLKYSNILPLHCTLLLTMKIGTTLVPRTGTARKRGGEVRQLDREV